MKKIFKEIKPLIKFISEDRKKLIISSIIIFVVGIFHIATGYLNGAAVEAITNYELRKSIYYLLTYFLIEICIDGVLYDYANSVLLKVESSLTRKLGYFTYKKSLELPAVAFEEKSSGEIINRITNDSDTLSFIFGRLLNLVSSLVSTFIIMIYIFLNSWIVALEILIIVFLLFLVIKYYSPKLKEVHKERKGEQDKFTSSVNESIRGIREIKTLGIKNNLITNLQELIKTIFNTSKKEIDIQKKFNIITSTLKSILEVGVFITCVILIYFNKISLTFFVAMTYYIYRYMYLIENINDLTQISQRLIVSLSRVNEILENRLYEDDKYGDVDIKDIKGTIEFKNVFFGYPNEEYILNDFNLKIVPNKKIAIVGKSGQGKSTLFNLITKLFNVTKGSILIDGIDLNTLSESALRNNISIIRQDPFLFNKSIKDNFLLVDKNVKLKEIREVCKLACIDDYIMSLPKKYNTILGEGGVNLSGGQKQRLAIARSFLKKSKIILFDEATSALDNQSQEYIKNTIDDMVKDHTVVIVAHRLSTIIDADIIHVIDKGRVVASGTHDELLKTCDIYQTLYNNESLNS